MLLGDDSEQQPIKRATALVTMSFLMVGSDSVVGSVHLSAHIIYAVLTQEALDPFVERTSEFLGGEVLSIALKLGTKRSIEHEIPNQRSIFCLSSSRVRPTRS